MHRPGDRTPARLAAAGAVSMALSVLLGAFGAHALRSSLDAYSLDIWEKAVFYHAMHSLGLILVPILGYSDVLSSAGAQRIALLLATGVVLFSGSLYLLAVTGIRALGAVTPLGGTAFIAAWLLLGLELLRRR